MKYGRLKSQFTELSNVSRAILHLFFADPTFTTRSSVHLENINMTNYAVKPSEISNSGPNIEFKKIIHVQL